MHPCNSFVISFRVPPRPVLDVVVDDEVQPLVGKPVARCQYRIYSAQARFLGNPSKPRVLNKRVWELVTNCDQIPL